MVEKNKEVVDEIKKDLSEGDRSPFEGLQDYNTLPYGYEDKKGKLHREVEFRELKGSDEEEISQGAVRNNIGKIVTILLANCTKRIGDYTKENMQKAQWEEIFRDMYIGDRDALLLYISEWTYGKEIDFDSRCPVCRESLIISFETGELEWQDPPTDPGHIEFTLPRGYKDNEGVIHNRGVVRMPNGLDQELLDKPARKNPGKGNTMLITRCMQELGNAKLSGGLFRDIGQKDRQQITKVMSDNVYGPLFEVKTVCDSCGSEFTAGVNPVNFIL